MKQAIAYIRVSTHEQAAVDLSACKPNKPALRHGANRTTMTWPRSVLMPA